MKLLCILSTLSILISVSCSNGQNDGQMKERLEKELTAIYPADEPGATVIAIRDGEIIFREAYGLANVELMVPMKPDMVFKLGSMTKQFTAIASMILEERDSLDLDDPLTEYFPDYPVNDKVITIRHLLSHTSGIPNYNGTYNYYGLPEWEGKIHQKITPEEIIDILKTGKIQFIPGDEWRYCNSDYTLLAKIIEKASGQTYEKFLTDNIFIPAGMNHTYIGNDDQVIPNLVNAYRKVEGITLKAEYMSMSHTYGAGDILSNIDDLARWMEALEKNKLLSSTSKNKCFQPNILNNGVKTNYGFGWYIGDLQGRKTLYHGGGVYGFVTHGVFLPEEKLYVVVLHNCVNAYARYPTHAVGDLIAGTILGLQEKSAERTSIQLSDDQLNKYIGEYKFEKSPGKRKISVENHKVYYERPPRNTEDPWNKTEIIPASKYLFYAEGRKSTIIFHFDALGEVTGFTVNQPFGRTVSTTKIK